MPLLSPDPLVPILFLVLVTAGLRPAQGGGPSDLSRALEDAALSVSPLVPAASVPGPSLTLSSTLLLTFQKTHYLSFRVSPYLSAFFFQDPAESHQPLLVSDFPSLCLTLLPQSLFSSASVLPFAVGLTSSPPPPYYCQQRLSHILTQLFLHSRHGFVFSAWESSLPWSHLIFHDPSFTPTTSFLICPPGLLIHSHHGALDPFLPLEL